MISTVCIAFILSSCAEASLISEFLVEEAATEETPNPQPTEPISVVLLEPTPTPISEIKETQPQIIFVSDRGTHGVTEIFQINSDGSRLIQLTNDKAMNRDPAWSPDRRQIAYASNRNGISQIYLLTLEDLEISQLTEHPGGASSPTWSPNGEQVAFIELGANNDTIYTTRLDGSGDVDSMKISVRGIENIAWAPTGNVIAFSAFWDRSDPSNRDIFTFDFDSKILVNLTNAPGVDDDPAWTPKGDRLAFQSNRNGNQDIFVMQADGTLQTPLTNDPASDVEPTWSSDGRLLAFSSDREGTFNLFLMDDSGSNQERLTSFEAEDRQPRWSLPPVPVVDEIAFAGGQLFSEIFNIFLVSSSGSKVSNLVFSETSDHTMPDWSPDGSKIVFSSNRNGNYDVYWFNTDGSGEPTQLTNHLGPDMHPAWSPDGNKIAFESKREEGDWDIWVVNADGSELRNLTASIGSDQGNPAWSPDGTQIAFSSNIGSDFDIYVINADGSGEVDRVTNLSGDEYFPAWSPDGRLIAFRGISPTSGNRQIFTIDRDGLGLRSLSSDRFNDDTPDWSPDGQQIVFVSDRANPGNRSTQAQYDVYIYDLNIGVTERITNGELDHRYPDWKPRRTSGNP